jgi:hypothetical protein
VLQLIVEGLPNKEIARRLNLAVGTVKIHVAVLFHKMNVTSRTAAAVAGARLLSASAPSHDQAASAPPTRSHSFTRSPPCRSVRGGAAAMICPLPGT